MLMLEACTSFSTINTSSLIVESPSVVQNVFWWQRSICVIVLALCCKHGLFFFFWKFLEFITLLINFPCGGSGYLPYMYICCIPHSWYSSITSGCILYCYQCLPNRVSPPRNGLVFCCEGPASRGTIYFKWHNCRLINCLLGLYPLWQVYCAFTDPTSTSLNGICSSEGSSSPTGDITNVSFPAKMKTTWFPSVFHSLVIPALETWVMTGATSIGMTFLIIFLISVACRFGDVDSNVADDDCSNFASDIHQFSLANEKEYQFMCISGFFIVLLAWPFSGVSSDTTGDDYIVYIGNTYCFSLTNSRDLNFVVFFRCGEGA